MTAKDWTLLESLIYEMPHCAACGRQQTEDHFRWKATVSSLVVAVIHPRLAERVCRRVVLPLCDIHVLREVPGALTFANVLWLKKARDPAYYEPKYYRKFLGTTPIPEEPLHLHDEYEQRMVEQAPEPGPDLFVLEQFGANWRTLTAVQMRLNVHTLGDLGRRTMNDLLAIPKFSMATAITVLNAMKFYINEASALSSEHETDRPGSAFRDSVCSGRPSAYRSDGSLGPPASSVLPLTAPQAMPSVPRG